MELLPARANLDVLIEQALATGGETSRFDFKEALDPRLDEHRVRLIKAIAAFANTDDGGFLFLGISDDRREVGLSTEVADAYDQTRLQKLIDPFLVPPPAVQARRHVRNGKELVVIEVAPFRDVPCIVRQSLRAGRENLQAGTIVCRTDGAESGVLTSESEMRKLCEAIANRRAAAIVELIRRGSIGTAGIGGMDGAHAKVLEQLRSHVTEYWGPAGESVAHIETSFEPTRSLDVEPDELTKALQRAQVPKPSHGFPFMHVAGDVYTPRKWGFAGRIPFSEPPDPNEVPHYLWLLSRSGAFLYREQFWEDERQKGGAPWVSLHHIIGRAVLLVRFLDRFTQALCLNSAMEFRLAMNLSNVLGRRLVTDEDEPVAPFAATCGEESVEARLSAPLAAIRECRTETVINLLQEVCWQFRATDLNRQDLTAAVNNTRVKVGKEYGFPEVEQLRAPT